MPSRYKNRKVALFTRKLLWCCCFFNVIPGLTFADELDTLQFIADVNKTYDNNLFRRSTNEVSDQATISTLGVRFNKAYALQRFMANVTYIDNKYQENDFLDYAATNYDAAWNWSLTPNLTGVLSSSRSERQINFRDIQTPTRNLITTKENVFRAEYSPHQVLSLIIGYSELTSENSRAFNAIASNEQVGLDYGVRYNFPSKSYIAFMGHRKQGSVTGRPLNTVLQFDTGFTTYQYDLEFLATDEGKSNLRGKIGYVEKENDNFSLRDYNGIIGSLNHELEWTGKLRSTVGIARGFGAFETDNSTYTTTDSLNASLSYEISAKIQASTYFSLSERDFEGRGRFDTSGRVDKEHAYGASISWRPIKNIGFSLRSTKSNRDSTLAQFDFDDTLTSVSVDFRI
ncbi:MAG: XrtB/PEP-CTERM-associated polysaccharide biosynthesis outer membrane protein EpsL [Methylophilus sp.]|uniref:XrtB/PEP-CTERM-associated polysaccharide biosynthesis outer membrane protein EpsL n=1 Tax=Methylophilus sp. TaxID=29541 RepID=UPI003FA0333E